MRRVVLQRLPLWLRPLLRQVIVCLFGVLGLLRVRGVARGKASAGETSVASLRRRYGTAVDLSASFSVKDQLPPLNIVYESGPKVTPRPVDTLTLVVDTKDRGFSFRNNVLVDPAGYVLTEDCISWRTLEASRTFLEPVTRLAGTVAYLSNTDIANIGHWLCYTLPLVGTYRERLGVEPDYYYVGKPLRDFHVESLAMLGIRREQIITHGVSADRTVAAIANRKHGALDGEMLRFVRRQIRGAERRGAATRRLFVGRRDAAFRRLINEDECFRLLQREYGFEYVTAGAMSLAEQVALFSSAECIVGPHGAGLTHILWAPRGVKVVDLFSSAHVNPFFMEVASFVGCDYAYIVGKAADRLARCTRRHREATVRRRADVLTDVEELDRAMKALGVQPTAATGGGETRVGSGGAR